jgi:glycosyltransferase involved in cell wall biosynthesis
MLLNYSDVAVVMITRNEELAVEKVVKDAFQHLPGCSVFVIDGSSDRTAELAALAGATVIQEPGGGFGPALHCALNAPNFEFAVVATVDADDTYPPEILPELVRLVRDGFDVAGANRLTVTPTKHMPLINWAANLAFNLIASIRAGQVIRDVHSGQRAYKRDLIKMFDWDYKGYAFPIDLIFWPSMVGLDIKEIQIVYRERIGETTLVRGPSGKASVRRLFRARNEIKGRYVKSR